MSDIDIYNILTDSNTNNDMIRIIQRNIWLSGATMQDMILGEHFITGLSIKHDILDKHINTGLSIKHDIIDKHINTGLSIKHAPFLTLNRLGGLNLCIA